MTYEEIHSMVMQMPMTEKEMLRQDLNRLFDDTLEETCPYTVEELQQFAAEGLADYRAGRYCTAEEGWKKLEEKFPWLKD